jgi:hypothetical protein
LTASRAGFHAVSLEAVTSELVLSADQAGDAHVTSRLPDNGRTRMYVGRTPVGFVATMARGTSR